MQMIPLLLITLLSTLAGCSLFDSLKDRPDYRPATAEDPIGYYSTSAGNSQFEVGYQGDHRVDYQTIEDFALQRAGELAVEQGGSGFDVLARQCSEQEVQRDVPALEAGVTQLQPTVSTLVPQHTMMFKLRRCTLAVEVF